MRQKCYKNTCKRRSCLQRRAGRCHLVTSHCLPLWSESPCNQFLMTGEEKALERIHPNNLMFCFIQYGFGVPRVCTLVYLGNPRCPRMEQNCARCPFCSATDLLHTFLAALISQPVFACVLFPADFLVAHLLNDVYILYLKSSPSPSPSEAVM